MVTRMFERPGFSAHERVQFFAPELDACEPENFTDCFRTGFSGAKLLQRSIAERGAVGKEAQSPRRRPPKIHGVQSLIDGPDMAGRNEAAITSHSGNWVREADNAGQSFSLQSAKAFSNEPTLAISGNLIEENQAAKFSAFDCVASKNARYRSIIRRIRKDCGSHEGLAAVEGKPETRRRQCSQVMVGRNQLPNFALGRHRRNLVFFGSNHLVRNSVEASSISPTLIHVDLLIQLSFPKNRKRTAGRPVTGLRAAMSKASNVRQGDEYIRGLADFGRFLRKPLKRQAKQLTGQRGNNGLVQPTVSLFSSQYQQLPVDCDVNHRKRIHVPGNRAVTPH